MNPRRISIAFLASTAIVTVLVACSAEPGSDAAATDTTAAAITPGVTETAPPAAPASRAGMMLDPNAATVADLTAIPGVTQPIADALVASRPYANNAAVDRVLAKHISEPARDSVYARLWMPIDLNTAPAAEILLIPGVGPRMRHEFEEYRPYDSIEKFRREIGKYVDAAEVARLERFVVIR